MLPDIISDECIICGATYYGGGLSVRGRYICGACERILVNTGCNSPFYRFYVNGLKKMWRCTMD